MSAIDPEFVADRTQVLENHLRRIQAALPQDSAEFKPGTDAADVVSLHLLLGIQVVLDFAIFACIHFGLQAPASYEDAVARLEHAGHITDPLADRLEKAAEFRDAFVHAFEQLDAPSIFRAARVLPDDLRIFMGEIAGQVRQ